VFKKTARKGGFFAGFYGSAGVFDSLGCRFCRASSSRRRQGEATYQSGRHRPQRDDFALVDEFFKAAHTKTPGNISSKRSSDAQCVVAFFCWSSPAFASKNGRCTGRNERCVGASRAKPADELFVMNFCLAGAGRALR
jgi:hypothetical protein